MVETVTSSPCRKKRGSTSRTIRFLRTITLLIAAPTLVSAVMPRAVARHVVSESGKANRTSAVPSALVSTVGFQ